jgi:hypothetical protein
MREGDMPSAYSKIILDSTGCSLREADRIEIMRDAAFHSTLDWQTREELEAAARTAYVVLQKLDEPGEPLIDLKAI